MVPARTALVLFVTIWLQVVLFSRIEVWGAKPNVVLLFVVVAALESDAERGALLGFVAGLSFDLLLDTPVGLSALSMVLVGWTVGGFKDSIMRTSRLVTALLVGAASVGGTLLYALLAVVFGVTVDWERVPAIVAVVAIANVVLTRPHRWALRWAFGPEGRSPTRDQFIFR
ncbi:MAG: rod shape-determining protein MreD [Acidimicrobiales bacterium]|nr:rod shape-determining protein MreD [Acidimicrobiales bacterium]